VVSDICGELYSFAFIILFDPPISGKEGRVNRIVILIIQTQKWDQVRLGFAQTHILRKVRSKRWWFTPVILATQEAEIRGMLFQARPVKIV
jgi:hypothetical protein